MTTDFYNALVAYAGREAVDAALDERDCEWGVDDEFAANPNESPGLLLRFTSYRMYGDNGLHWCRMPDPAAQVILEAVAEGLVAPSVIHKSIFGDGTYAALILKDGKITSMVGFPTKTAALMAAMQGGKG